MVRVGEFGLEADGAGRGVDLVVDDGQLAGSEQRRAAGGARFDRRLAGGERGGYARQVVLRRSEDDGDRLDLGDGDDAGLLRRVDHVALVDEAETDAAGDRGGDCGVIELHLGRVDRCGVGRLLGDKLVDQRVLGVELLLGGEALLGEGRIALEVEPGVGERRLILGLLGLGLVEGGLERARVDLRQKVAGLDHLAFIEGDLDDLAVDAGADGHRVLGLRLAEPVDEDGIVGPRRRSHRNDGRLRRVGGGAGRRRRLRLGGEEGVVSAPRRRFGGGKQAAGEVGRVDAEGDGYGDDRERRAGQSSRSHDAVVPPAGDDAGRVRSLPLSPAHV